MSLWTKLRDVVVKPLARTVIPGFSAAEQVLSATRRRTPAGTMVPLTQLRQSDIAGPLDLFDLGVKGPGIFAPAPKKRRRMNPANPKAAKRAIRRIKATRKLLRDIEKQLPRRPAPTRRSAPRGHRRHLHHTDY